MCQNAFKLCLGSLIYLRSEYFLLNFLAYYAVGGCEDHLRSCSSEGRSVRLIIVDGAFGEGSFYWVGYILKDFDRTSIHIHISE